MDKRGKNGMRKHMKAVIITVVCLVLVAAIVIGIFWFLGRRSDPVPVGQVSYFTNYYGESSQSGLVTAEKLQKVYASGTQEITELLVTEGQEVKSGDALFRYDTTLSDIQLERQKIAVQQAELSLERAKDELKEINALKPYVPTQPPTEPPTEPSEPTDPPTEPPTDPPTEPPTEPTEPPIPAEELPYLLGGQGTEADPYRYLCDASMVYNNEVFERLLGEETQLWIRFEVRLENSPNGELQNSWGVLLSRDEEHGLQFTLLPPTVAAQNADDSSEPQPDADGQADGGVDTAQDQPATRAVRTTSTASTYAGGQYTSAEIAQMKAEKQKEIRDLDLSLRQTKVELEQMKNEVENSAVYATVDGIVMQLTDAETARQNGSPVMVISGGGCYYVKSAISEYDLGKYPVGTQVRIFSWMTGTEIYGTIDEITDTPASNDLYWSENPNATYYTILIAVDSGVELREGEYVEVYLSAQSSQENALYLSNMFIRQDDGGSYVYKRGEDGLLVKQYVRTGTVQWGSTEILDGLTMEDMITFPYGKDVKEGAQTVESDDPYSDFYGY